ncbi:UvrD-helicase domain-containing protein [Nostoc ellipsosporum NOK]|nr:UvrD-helicase domain-containing protein [Nostoc ellipsosporum NOK]
MRQLTDEQQAIIDSTGDIRINAVAGSGKTTTLIEYAASRPAGSKILYLAFNKSVKLEAQRKFAERDLSNVRIETAHSLAYKHIFRSTHYRLKSGGYKMYEIVELLGLRGNGEKHAEYIIANHILKFISYFCNSDKAKVQELNYLDTINDPNAHSFVQSFYKYIEDGTRLFLSKMDKGEIEITHDFYLKKFQLSNPVLRYDYILFDEGQDASGAMLSVFLNQKAVKVIVGDTHQQIYGWRYAVNSLEKTDFETFHLSSSFRFQQPIANLANEVLKWKKHLKKYTPVLIKGKGASTTEKSKATIARTNLGLLLSAIDFVTDNPKARHLYFEGNINSYTYADDGASLYDVLSLYNNNRDRVRDKLIQSMKDLDDLEDYVEKTEDVQLGMMAGIVREYGNEIPGILKKLKDLHTGDDNRDDAEMIFSTVHRAKGMEYDVVYLANDFIKESDLERAKSAQQKENFDLAKLNEEINLLYVAVTRTKNILHIPTPLLPENFPSSPLIKAYDVFTGEEKPVKIPVNKKNTKTGAQHIRQIKEKAYTVAAKRETFNDAYKPWTSDLDEELRYLYESDNPISAIADHFGRTKGAIISRLKKLNYFTE